MTTAQLVNRILDKLRTARVVFSHIDSSGDIVIEYAGYTYEMYTIGDLVQVRIPYEDVYEYTNENSYTRWLEGVLNGKLRSDAGELVDTSS